MNICYKGKKKITAQKKKKVFKFFSCRSEAALFVYQSQLRFTAFKKSLFFVKRYLSYMHELVCLRRQLVSAR